MQQRNQILTTPNPRIAPIEAGGVGLLERLVRRCRAAAVFVLKVSLFSLPVVAQAQLEVVQQPLTVGGQGVPGNLVLVPSVEWPTLNSVANLGDYNSSVAYAGYFDSAKCYEYIYDAGAESNRRFEPSSQIGSAPYTCSGAKEWSGNFLNWAATQTIDPFRKALTGGYRVKDTPTETWLEKAHHDGQGSLYPDRELDDSGVIAGATPFTADSMRLRIDGLGNGMRFRLNHGVYTADEDIKDYDGSGSVDAHSVDRYGRTIQNVYDLSVRVKVCESDSNREDNCKPYEDGWKPEGTIQANADSLRYSIFGFLNDSDAERDGGVLRARIKWTGPRFYDESEGVEVDNPLKEWDPDTGVLEDNPSPDDASETQAALGINIDNSGVINYLNKFGQMTGEENKSHDPVSELYYAALRYFRDEGNVSAYTDMSGEDAPTKRQYSDLFPVVTDWDDGAVSKACEPNVILGIGDVYTHRDKNLPGSGYSQGEPAKPAEVSADGDVDVVEWTNKVGELEAMYDNLPGLNGSIGQTNSWSGRSNSAYIAGLAYWANTTDLRDDLDGKQTVSTFWVDVLENQTLEAPNENQYYLAAKYGGFDVPDDFEPLNHDEALDEAWWHTNTDTLTSFGAANPSGHDFERPDNYYVAAEADAMIEQLNTAFDDIVAEVSQGSGSAIAANSTRLDTGTLIYQARFKTGEWTGQLLALEVDEEDGSVDPDAPLWDAAEEIPAPDGRDIYTIDPSNNVGKDFDWNDGLTADQKTALNTNIDGNNDSMGSARLDYLRGDASKELQNGGNFRSRIDSDGDHRVLGDIVNSDPAFVGAGHFGFTRLGGDAGEAYPDFMEFKKERTEMVYIGANDGMLHGFDANNGDEVFAYVPNAVFDKLSYLTSPHYVHRYYVDGSPRVGDAYIDVGNGDEWRSILVGGLGAGGRAVYALDVTDPDTFSTADADDMVLWEFTDPNLGLSMSQPYVVMLGDGEWYVVFGNGYNSEDDGADSGAHDAGIFIVPLEDPESAQYYSTEVGDDSNPNGMGHTTPVDTNGDRIADFIYGGDLHGNLWKLDVSASNGNWEYAHKQGQTPEPLFTAEGPDGNPQPITAPPEVGGHPDGGVMVYFGTGKFFEEGDNVIPDSPQIQSFYAIRDDGDQVDDDNLKEQTIDFEGTPDGADFEFRVTSDNPVDYDSGDDGWYIDLAPPPGNDAGEGERVVNRPILRGDRIIFVTNIPSPDVCKGGGDSWIMEMHALSGSRLDQAVFDVNNDGSIDNTDDMARSGNNDLGHAGGRKFEDDMVRHPAILDAGGRSEQKYFSGSSGEVTQLMEQGEMNYGRESWRELWR